MVKKRKHMGWTFNFYRWHGPGFGWMLDDRRTRAGDNPQIHSSDMKGLGDGEPLSIHIWWMFANPPCPDPDSNRWVDGYNQHGTFVKLTQE